jgi:hypothetical protein
MHIKIKSLKTLLCVMIIIFTCLAFPLQVYAMSPFPSLLPYVFFSLLIMVALFGKESSYLQQWDLQNIIAVEITLFFILVNVSIFLQIYLGYISFKDLLTVYVRYVLPIIFYVYFSRTGSDNELRVIMKTIVILGFINAIYFLYDNYNMIVLGEVSSISKRMYEYSNFRAGNETVAARIWASNRGHGLLERHSVSSAWIAIGSFAYFAIKPNLSFIKKSLIVFLTMLTLLLSMNFTSFVGYLLITILFEMHLFQLFYGKIYVKSFKNIFMFMIMIFLLFIPLIFLLDSRLTDYLFNLLLSQVYLGSGVTEYGNSVYLMQIFNGLFLFTFNMISYPIAFIIGDGYSDSFSITGKGGDYGIVETLNTLGMPFFLIVMYGLTRLVIKSYNLLNKKVIVNLHHANYLRFAMCTTSFIIFHEIHMSIWNTKSILPLLFLSLAIFNRYFFNITRLLKSLPGQGQFAL